MVLKELSNIVVNKQPSTGKPTTEKPKGRGRSKKAIIDPATEQTVIKTEIALIEDEETNENSNRTQITSTPRPIDKENVVTPDNVQSTTVPKVKSDLDGLLNGFGRISLTQIRPNVRKVYKIIRNLTGSIGGNAAGGAIYGELTVGSMQKVVDLMKEHCEFSSESRFIDVGCGLGKPNVHVAQDPGVEFSYGIELIKARWVLGMLNLNHVLKAARKQDRVKEEEDAVIGHRCMFAAGDITEANCFDPFTHVYMFDIGFPPTLFKTLGEMFNRSKSKYLICYHAPRLMIDRYGFDVELIHKDTTSMHGSAEGHMGYFYRKRNCDYPANIPTKDVPCDPLFRGPWDLINSGLEKLGDEVNEQVDKEMSSGRPQRSRRARTPFSPSKDNSIFRK